VILIAKATTQQPAGDTLTQRGAIIFIPLSPAGGREGRVRGSLPIGAPKLANFAQDCIQTESLDELHRVVMQPVMLADAEDRDDVRVVQPRRRLGLAPKSLKVRGR
jgi:hypothetical protein